MSPYDFSLRCDMNTCYLSFPLIIGLGFFRTICLNQCHAWSWLTVHGYLPEFKTIDFLHVFTSARIT